MLLQQLQKHHQLEEQQQVGWRFELSHEVLKSVDNKTEKSINLKKKKEKKEN